MSIVITSEIKKTGVDFTKGKTPLRKGSGKGSFGKHLTDRDKKGQFRSVKRQTNRLRNLAMISGITEALLEIVSVDLGIFSRTVARKTGKLRRAVWISVKKIVGKISHHGGKTVINWKEIISGILSRDTQEYFIYHIRGRGFYMNPTEKGTFPIRFSRFKPMARSALRRTIDKKLKKFGIQDRVTFTV